MGAILSRLRGKPSTKEMLEELEKEIETLEEYKRSTEQQHKRVVGSLIFYSILLYIVAAGVFFVYYLPSNTRDRILYMIPLLLFPFVLFLFKRFLHWYFNQKIKYNEETLTDLKKRRRALLDYAMETETYKAVKELLEKFDPEYQKKIFEVKPAAIEAPPSAMSLKGSFSEADLRKRTQPNKVSTLVLANPAATVTFNREAGSSTVFPPFPGKPATNPPFPPAFLQRNGQPFVRLPLQQMPRPVLPRERTVFDRIVDYIVGDGPSNRYALICRQCHSHNGMALKEEFEFMAFRCCYCFHWNSSRSQQTSPQRLQLPAPNTSPTVTEPASASEVSTSSEEAENESVCDTDGVTSSNANIESYSPDSPDISPLRHRFSTGSDNEIVAKLEEDKDAKFQENQHFSKAD